MSNATLKKIDELSEKERREVFEFAMERSDQIVKGKDYKAGKEEHKFLQEKQNKGRSQVASIKFHEYFDKMSCRERVIFLLFQDMSSFLKKYREAYSIAIEMIDAGFQKSVQDLIVESLEKILLERANK